MDCATILLSLFIALFIAWILQKWFKNRVLPPGPSGLPFLGYYHSLDNEHYITLADLSKRYKSDVISFKTLGGSRIIILNGLKVIKEVLVSRAEEFSGRPTESNLVDWTDNGLGILQSEGPVWKEQKRFFLQAAKEFGFGKAEFEINIQEEIEHLRESLKKLEGEPFNPADLITHTTTNVICYIFCIKSFFKDETEFQKFVDGIHHLVEIFSNKRLFLVGTGFELFLSFTSTGRKARAYKKFLHKAVEEIVDKHIQTFDSQNIRNFVDAYLLQINNLKEKSEHEGSSFTVERLRAILLMSLIDGIESVTFALCGILTLLSQHPDAQKKAQEELDNVVGREKMPSWLDRQNLPYVEILLLELLRINQPFFVSTVFSNFEETKIQNYRIPKRSILFANWWTINNDPDIFPEPSKFDPTRYLSLDGKRIKKDGPVPFGVGKRSCAGESLATMEIFLIVTAILQNFTLEYVSKDKITAILRKDTEASVTSNVH